MAVLAAASTARADEQVQRAKQLADEGRRFHSEGHYAAAIAAYKDAYVLAPRAGLLFNLAQAYRLAGDCAEAAWMYQRFLASAPSSEQSSLARHHLARVEPCLHPQHPLPDPPPPPGAREKEIGVWLAAGGGGAIILGAVFAIDAHHAESEINGAYHIDDPTINVRDLDEHGQRSAALAKVFLIGGAVAVVSGGVFYAIGHHHEHTGRLSIAPQPGGAEVSLAWAF
jgi:hypothetical protein